MAESLYATSVSILFSTNGSEMLLGLAKQTEKTNATVNLLLGGIKSLDAAIMGLGATATTATSRMQGFADVTGSIVGAARAATDATLSATAGFRANGAAAAAASMEIARYRDVLLSTRAAMGFSLGASGGGRTAVGARSSEIALASVAAPLALSGAGGGGTGVGARGRGLSGFAGGSAAGGAFSGMFGGGGSGGGFGGFGGAGGLGGSAGGAISSVAMHPAFHAAVVGADIVGGALLDGVYNAAKLQTILQSTQNILGASSAQMAAIRKASFEVGDRSGMSAVQTAEMFRDFSRQSVGAMSVGDMLGILPKLGQMQLVLGAARGFSPHQTVDSVMALTHLFRAYDPKGQSAMLSTVLKMGELMPDNLQRAVTQMTLFEPTLKNLHVKDEEAAALMVSLSRFGMGRGKGGSSVNDLFSAALGPLQLTAHAQAGKAKLLGPGQLDVLDAQGRSRYFTDRNGDPFGFLMALNRFAETHGTVDATKTFRSAFGVQGSRIANLMSDRVVVGQLQNIHGMMVGSNTLGLDAQAGSLTGMARFQVDRSFKNLESLLTEVGSVALPGVTKGFRDLGDGLHGAQHWLHEHRDLELKVQRDILGGVKGTESWIVSHKADWMVLRNDLRDVYGAAAKAGPAIGMVADAFVATYRDVSDLFHGMGVARSLVRDKLGHVENGIDWMLGRGGRGGSNGMSDTGLFPTPAPLPKGFMPPGHHPSSFARNDPNGFGPPTIVQHFHGTINLPNVQHPHEFAKALQGATRRMNVQSAGATHGHVVTSGSAPRSLTTPK